MERLIKIFDLGSNTFRQTRNLINSFSKHEKVVEVHTFEPQKNLALDSLDDLKKDYSHITFTHNNVAAWNNYTNLNFYECKTWGPNYKGGSSLIPHKGPPAHNDLEYNSPVLTSAINFIEYFEKHSSTGMYNFIKMDIEGAEYIILPELLKSSSIDNLSELACEWHVGMYKTDSHLGKKFNLIHREVINNLKSRKIKLSHWA
jgi:FkbM family methyltransferase